MPPKGSSLTNNLPLGQRKSKPGPSSHPPSHTNSLLPTQLSSNPLDASLDNSHTQPDPEGPDSDVAFLNNNTFETNAQGGDISFFFSFSNMIPEHLRNETFQIHMLLQTK